MEASRAIKEFSNVRRAAGIRIQYGGKLFPPAQNQPEEGVLLPSQLNQERENHEKNALEHCLGSGGIVCVGAGLAAAAYAAATVAATANHYYDDDHD
jgi:hypothetical protein